MFHHSSNLQKPLSYQFSFVPLNLFIWLTLYLVNMFVRVDFTSFSFATKSQIWFSFRTISSSIIAFLYDLFRDVSSYVVDSSTFSTSVALTYLGFFIIILSDLHRYNSYFTCSFLTISNLCKKGWLCASSEV